MLPGIRKPRAVLQADRRCFGAGGAAEFRPSTTGLEECDEDQVQARYPAQLAPGRPGTVGAQHVSGAVS